MTFYWNNKPTLSHLISILLSKKGNPPEKCQAESTLLPFISFITFLNPFHTMPSYLDTPEFLIIACHILTLFEVPIHIYGGYLILFKTPKKMGSVKWYMFNVHFWSALLDFSLSFLVIPFMLFPVAAGYPYGVFAWIGLDPAVQTTVIVIEIGFTIISILVLFENRYTFLAHSENFWMYFRKSLIIMLYIAALTYFIPFNFQVPDQSIAGPAMIQKFHTIHIPYSGPIFVFSQDSSLMVLATSTKLIIEFAFILILVALTFVNIIMTNRHKTLSQCTLALQKKFFISITIQTAVPFCVILLPLIYVALSFVQVYYNQALNNISFLIISSHGLISTIAMLFIHKPYRDATFQCGVKIKQRRQSSLSRIFVE